MNEEERRRHKERRKDRKKRRNERKREEAKQARIADRQKRIEAEVDRVVQNALDVENLFEFEQASRKSKKPELTTNPEDLHVQ